MAVKTLWERPSLPLAIHYLAVRKLERNTLIELGNWH